MVNIAEPNENALPFSYPELPEEFDKNYPIGTGMSLAIKINGIKRVFES